MNQSGKNDDRLSQGYAGNFSGILNLGDSLPV